MTKEQVLEEIEKVLASLPEDKNNDPNDIAIYLPINGKLVGITYKEINNGKKL